MFQSSNSQKFSKFRTKWDKNEKTLIEQEIAFVFQKIDFKVRCLLLNVFIPLIYENFCFSETFWIFDSYGFF